MAGPVALVATATWGPSKPLSVLNDLISRRVKDLGQTAQDAVVATAITVLKSLKAMTRDASKRKSFEVGVEQHADLYVSLDRHGDVKRPCLRRGSRKGPKVHNNFYFAAKGMDLKRTHVFWVTPEHENAPPYFLVAYSESQALMFEAKRTLNRVADYGGLAKTALGIAMAKISTKNEPTPSFRKNIEKSKIIAVNIEGANGGKFGVTVHDKLGYSIPALRGGAAAMNVALMKAANKVAGQLAQGLKRIGSFEQPIPTPFPEVKRRR